MEKLIRQIVASNKVYEVEIDMNTDTVTGDLDPIKKSIKSVKVSVEDFGIGSYDAGGKQGVDEDLGYNIEEQCTKLKIKEIIYKEGDYNLEDVVDLLLKKISVDDKMHYENKKAGEADFKLKITEEKILEKNENDILHSLTLCWEVA